MLSVKSTSTSPKIRVLLTCDGRSGYSFASSCNGRPYGSIHVRQRNSRRANSCGARRRSTGRKNASDTNERETNESHAHLQVREHRGSRSGAVVIPNACALKSSRNSFEKVAL
jgi:hypothetical protein